MLVAVLSFFGLYTARDTTSLQASALDGVSAEDSKSVSTVFNLGTHYKQTGSIKYPGAVAKKEMYLINGTMTGPTIVATKGDTITVVLKNRLLSGVAHSMHWHGMYQVGTPYYDGVDGISQCSIQSNYDFTYQFKAWPAGTHWYHSHTGVQYGDGLRGLLLVKDPDDPNKALYDHDLLEHMLLIADYMPETSNAILMQLIEGNLPSPTVGDGVDWSDTPWYGAEVNGKNDDEPYLLSVNPNVRARRELRTPHGAIHATSHGASTRAPDVYVPCAPLCLHTQERYRLRLCAGGESWNLVFSIPHHDLTIIAVDGEPTEPYTVSSVLIAPGDRVDVVISTTAVGTEFDVTVAYQGHALWYAAAGNYSEGEDPPPDKSKPVPLSKPAKLVYTSYAGPQPRSSSKVTASSATSDEAVAHVTESAAVPAIWDPTVSIAPLVLSHASQYAKVPEASRSMSIVLQGDMKNYQWWLAKDMAGPFNFFEYPKYPPTYAGFAESDWKALVPPKGEEDVAEMGMKGMPMTTRGTLVYDFDVGEVVDIDFINLSGMAHPMHVHGHGWYVLGTSGTNRSNTGKMLKQMGASFYKKPYPKNVLNPPWKDTILVPPGGVTTVRFIANNPGVWAMHCHIEYHMAMGMFSVFKIGHQDQWPSPTKAMKMPPCNADSPAHSDGATKMSATTLRAKAEALAAAEQARA